MIIKGLKHHLRISMFNSHVIYDSNDKSIGLLKLDNGKIVFLPETQAYDSIAIVEIGIFMKRLEAEYKMGRVNA